MWKTPTINSDEKTQRLVICVGDIHGYYTKLEKLWWNLKSATEPSEFSGALVIFLGDYCDRGPDTKGVLDFLISLPSKHPNQTHVFLSGNHDFAFAAFVGALPAPGGGREEFRETWKEYRESELREGWYRGEGLERMHLQGRRWAGEIRVKHSSVRGTDYLGSIYDAAPTFHSYGVPHGSSDLIKAVPEEHKKFLADMVWVHEEHCRLIAVHAGLESEGVEEQLRRLKSKDTTIPKVEALSGRRSVWNIPEELKEKPIVIVSGHHGKLHIEGLRLIIDEGGGYIDKPVAAIILPSMKLVRDTDIFK
ncbi:hypothetical protein V2J09_004248 [Rumex salicifolius]